MIEATNNDAKRLFESLLEGSMCQIVVKMDETVLVPVKLRDSEILQFNLSWAFKKPMEIRADGIAALLSFQGQHFDCWFPYVNILGVTQFSTNDRWVFGTENVTGEARRVALLIDPGPKKRPEAAKPSKGSHLRLVK